MITADQMQATVIVLAAIEAARVHSISNDNMAAALLRGFIDLAMVSPDRKSAADGLVKIADALRVIETPARN